MSVTMSQLGLLVTIGFFLMINSSLTIAGESNFFWNTH